MLNWLEQMKAEDFTLLHLPDYDPVGLSEFGRLRRILGKHARLHIPLDLEARFERYSSRLFLERSNNRALLATLRKSSVPEIGQVIAMIDRANGCLEQEALLLPV
jgi:hypothetical protein